MGDRAVQLVYLEIRARQKAMGCVLSLMIRYSHLFSCLVGFRLTLYPQEMACKPEGCRYMKAQAEPVPYPHFLEFERLFRQAYQGLETSRPSRHIQTGLTHTIYMFG